MRSGISFQRKFTVDEWQRIFFVFRIESAHQKNMHSKSQCLHALKGMTKAHLIKIDKIKQQRHQKKKMLGQIPNGIRNWCFCRISFPRYIPLTYLLRDIHESDFHTFECGWNCKIWGIRHTHTFGWVAEKKKRKNSARYGVSVYKIITWLLTYERCT